ncbi:flagellar basal body rod protein FlgB [Salibacterium lacus]|uniref:Flagellar basal body rod protein FlgB n=1 Tax=Salibacterium lacus TaxID=1898109 RepID=A0ABW5SZT5_9BACI
MGLFDSATFHNLEQGLKGAATRQKTISDNISNVDTPNYKAKSAHFKHTLNEAMQNDKIQAQQTNQQHIPFGGNGSDSIYVSRDTSTMYNHNGNNVDIDKEMTDSAKNQIYYNALTDRLSSKFSSLKTAVRSN